MKLPSNMTEQEVLDVIEKVVARLAYKFRFGYHDIDDMKQQGRLAAWKSLEAYDESRKLEPYLWTSVRNSLYNFKRNKFERPDKPCLKCPVDAYCIDTDICNKYEDTHECHWYYGWIRRNATKKNLMTPVTLAGVRDEDEDNMKLMDNIGDAVENAEIYQLIDSNIPMNLRRDWLISQEGSRLPKPRREKLQHAIGVILEEHGIDVKETW